MARFAARWCNASSACFWLLVRGGREEGRGADGVPVMREREQLMRVRPELCWGKTMGRASKGLCGDGLQS